MVTRRLGLGANLAAMALALAGCQGLIMDSSGAAAPDGGPDLDVTGRDAPGADDADAPAGTADAAAAIDAPAPADPPDAPAPGAPDAAVPGAADAAPPGPADAAVPPALDCRNPASWPAGWTAYEDQVLVLVNMRRAAGATCGGTAYGATAALAMQADLREAARCHSLDMATQDYFSHTGLDGSSPWDRIARAGYGGSAIGENIAAGYGSPGEVVSGWMSSSGHCSNIMNPSATQIGVGYAYDGGSSFGHYWTQTFGR